jgi:hypothetical protein
VSAQAVGQYVHRASNRILLHHLLENLYLYLAVIHKYLPSTEGEH